MANFDGEAPELKNVPIQDLNVTVSECIAPTTQLVIAADNDPCFEGGIVIPTDEVSVSISKMHLYTAFHVRLRSMRSG